VRRGELCGGAFWLSSKSAENATGHHACPLGRTRTLSKSETTSSQSRHVRQNWFPTVFVSEEKRTFVKSGPPLPRQCESFPRFSEKAWRRLLSQEPPDSRAVTFLNTILEPSPAVRRSSILGPKNPAWEKAAQSHMEMQELRRLLQLCERLLGLLRRYP
jgi:hypothetical protein